MYSIMILGRINEREERKKGRQEGERESKKKGREEKGKEGRRREKERRAPDHSKPSIRLSMIIIT